MSDDEQPSVDFQLPITPTDDMFIELNEEMRKAIDAGFERDEAFTLIRILFRSRVTAAFFSTADDDDESDDNE